MNVRHYNKLYARKRRKKLKEDGVCTVCAIRRPEPGYVTCWVCIELAKERNRAK